MASNFNANQFEGTFKPPRLGNWQVPVRQSQRPRTRSGCTKFVADDNGHLLPGLARSSPWCRMPFTAWDHPKRITKAHIKQMEMENNKHFASWLKRSAHMPLLQQEAPPSPDEPLQSEEPAEPKESERRTTRQSSAHSSARSSLLRPLESLSEIKPPSGVSSRRSSIRPHTVSTRSSDRSNQSSAKLPAPVSSLRSDQSAPPLAKAFSTAQTAKVLAEESRAHQPLADKVHDPLFCSLHTKKTSNSGLNLLAPVTAKSDEHPHRSLPRRPSTSHPLSKLTDMDLAIRWDLRIPDKGLSFLPKPAPAVFNTVPPKESPKAIAVKNAWEETPVLKDVKTSSPAEAILNQKLSRHATKNSHPKDVLQSVPQKNDLAYRRSQSTPNLARRQCDACELMASSKDIIKNPGTCKEFKQAFKAGKPNNRRPYTAAAKQVVVPKPKLPFSKRSYSIGTLAPPFSLWPDGTRRQDYPDHWRLASVYQHSYKPIEYRKGPLLNTVFQ